jgi:MarR-like DNA-binding transcriptional regulator SgrR of sgrS sRNA
MSLVDEKVLAFIRDSADRRLSFLDIAARIGCAPITVRRSVHRLKASGRLTWQAPQGRVFEFDLTPDEDERRD